MTIDSVRLLLLGAATAVLPAQEPGAAYREALATLCSEAMAGRAAGTEGGERAVVWLAEQFAALGLQPAVGGALRQDFVAPDPLPPGCLPRTACCLHAGGEARELVTGKEWMPFPFSPDHGAEGDADAPLDVVFAGHGLCLPVLDLDDYRGLDVRGKAVLLLRGGPRWQEPDAPVRAHLGELSFRCKAAAAAARGAAAVLLVDRQERAATGLDAESVQRARGSASVPFAWVDRAAVGAWFPGGGLLLAQQELDAGGAPRALLAGARVELCVALQRRPALATANVLGLARASPAAGEAPGADGAAAGADVIVVGAHHDHIGRGEFGSLAAREDLGRIHPGADDNASGVAALLELARRWQRRGGRRGVVFAAFGAEELGQAGSRYLLAHAEGLRIVAMLDLDMIGRARSQALCIHGVGTGDGLSALVAAAARGAEANSTLRIELRPRSSYRSDQSAFLEHRIPALLLTTGLHDEYHRPGDVPRLVEVDAALAVVDLAEVVLRQLADGPARAFVGAGR